MLQPIHSITKASCWPGRPLLGHFVSTHSLPASSTDTAIALSGGVDSSVAAALLVEAGRDVFGVTMRLGLAEIAGRACCGEEEVSLARRVCAQPVAKTTQPASESKLR